MAITIQKANFWKRISAWMFDAVMTIVIAMGLAIPTLQIFRYDEYYEQFTAIQTVYTEQAETKYGIDFDLSAEEYNQMGEDAKSDYNQKKAEAQKEINDNLEKDEQATKLSSQLISIMVSTFCISLFLTFMVWYFVLPIIFKHGRTLGKKIFGLAVIRTNCVKISTPVLFVRSIIGLYAMETMAVLLLCTMGSVGIIAAGLVQVLQIFVMFRTPMHASIHDLLSDSAVVDYASQQIFDTQEELEAYKAQEAAEASETSDVSTPNTEN